ncbi:MAG: UbiX family flavin prenyltransferase [Rhodospirillaceae bacterium]
MAQAQRLIVGITGASGIIYGVRFLEVLKDTPIETHLVMSQSAEVTLAYESNLKVAQIKDLADVVYSNGDIGAAISSGSFHTMGMVIAPCSIRSASEIATGVTSTLLTRAADVVLKERRRLVLLLRESPLHTGHLRTLTHLSEIGAVISPPVPAFYANPESINDIVNHTIGRALDMFSVHSDLVRRWGEPDGAGKLPRKRTKKRVSSKV